MASTALDARDPDAIRRSLPQLWLLSSLWFRSEVRGLGHIPEDGPVLLVGNHSGGAMTPDTAVFTLAFSAYFGVERPFYQLAPSRPGLGFLRPWGKAAPTPDNAELAVRDGAALLLYPGGEAEAHRPSWRSATVDLGGSDDFVRLASAHDVPIVPVVSIGGQETALFLGRLGRLPLSLSLPWGINVGDLLGHLPLPAKIVVEVLPPIDVRADFGPGADPAAVAREVQDRMQTTLDALAGERRLPVIG
jgi:1-acyl-sn-glycerol-3-phosphate acyltransferase